MYQDFVGSSLALMLTLDKPEHQWLAEYFVARYPTSAESNPTLPRRIVAERLKKNLLAGSPVDHLIDAHVLTPAQWRAVLDLCSPQGLSVEYLVARQWPRKGHMVAAALRDDTATTATLLVHNASTRSFWSLPLDDQIQIVERANTCARLSWLAQSTDPHVLQRFGPTWITEGNGDKFAECLHALVEEQHHNLDFFVNLNDLRVNEVLASTRHLKTELDQRRVVGLNRLCPTASRSDVENWCFANHKAARLLLNNPRCQLAVREELAALVEKYLHDHPNELESNYLVRDFNVALRRTYARQPITGEYEELEDKYNLYYLSVRCLNVEMPPGYLSRHYDAKALARNPHLTHHYRALLDCAESPRDHAGPFRLVTTRALRRQWFEQRGRIDPIERFVTGVGRTVEWFFRHLRQGEGLPEGFTGWLITTLGDTPAVWDAFLALSENWEGTLGELAECAKNLTQP